MNHDEMDSMSLIEYRARVERAAQNRNAERIYNGTTEHAQVVIETLFRTADKDVLVLNSCINNKVFGTENTLEAADAFLNKEGASIRVLVENEPAGGWKDNLFVRKFGERKNVSIKLVPDYVKSMFDFHFTVADKASYRFEADKTKHAAIASFGDDDAGQNLASIFEKLWPVGVNIEIQRALA